MGFQESQHQLASADLAFSCPRCPILWPDPAGHHEMNVVFHALNAVLLLWVLRQATGYFGRSFMVAALFAIHPINVEAVAWVAERKTMLSTAFFLLGIRGLSLVCAAATETAILRRRIAVCAWLVVQTTGNNVTGSAAALGLLAVGKDVSFGQQPPGWNQNAGKLSGENASLVTQGKGSAILHSRNGCPGYDVLSGSWTS